MIKKIPYILLYIIISFLIFYLSSGFTDEILRKIEAVYFVVFFLVFSAVKKIRIYSFVIIAVSFILMGIFYLFNILAIAVFLGNIGFGALIIIFLIFIPHLIAHGYLKDVNMKIIDSKEGD